MDSDYQDNICNLIDLLNGMDFETPSKYELENAISLASELQRAYDELYSE